MNKIVTCLCFLSIEFFCTDLIYADDKITASITETFDCVTVFTPSSSVDPKKIGFLGQFASSTHRSETSIGTIVTDEDDIEPWYDMVSVLLERVSTNQDVEMKRPLVGNHMEKLTFHFGNQQTAYIEITIIDQLQRQNATTTDIEIQNINLHVTAEAEFIRGNWDNFIAGERIMLKLTDDGEKKFLNAFKNAYGPVFHAELEHVFRVFDEFRFTQDFSNEQETVFSGNKNTLHMKRGPLVVEKTLHLEFHDLRYGESRDDDFSEGSEF